MPNPRGRSWLAAARDKGLIRDNSVKMILLPGGTETCVELPPPPSTNNLFFTKGKRRFKTDEYKAWLASAVPILSRLKRPDLPCEIYLYLIGNWNERRDGSNTVKAVEDALVAAGVIPDDSLKYVRREVWVYEEADCDPVIRVRFSP